MQLQLEAAEAERAEDDLAVPLDPFVGRLDAEDAERRLRVAVCDQLDRRIVLPVLFLKQRDADAAGGDDDLRALDCLRAGGVVDGLDRRSAQSRSAR